MAMAMGHWHTHAQCTVAQCSEGASVRCIIIILIIIIICICASCISVFPSLLQRGVQRDACPRSGLPFVFLASTLPPGNSGIATSLAPSRYAPLLLLFPLDDRIPMIPICHYSTSLFSSALLPPPFIPTAPPLQLGISSSPVRGPSVGDSGSVDFKLCSTRQNPRHTDLIVSTQQPRVISVDPPRKQSPSQALTRLPEPPCAY